MKLKGSETTDLSYVKHHHFVADTAYICFGLITDIAVTRSIGCSISQAVTIQSSRKAG